MGERFDMGKSSANDSFMRVIKALNDIVEDVIIWPREGRRITVNEKFQCIGRLPHVIGAIDGTNIPIKAPKVVYSYHRNENKVINIFLSNESN